MSQAVAFDDPGLGLGDPVLDGQSVFRAVLDAMAGPGSVHSPTGLPADGGDHAALIGVALTLLDHDTPVWLDDAARAGSLPGRLAFHCGCPQTSADKAAFALLLDAAGLVRLDAYAPGVPEFPDRSTTLVCALPALEGGEPLTLFGPGIADTRPFAPVGLPDGFFQQWDINHAAYPLGVDLILTSGPQLAALPRTTRIGG